MATSKAKTVTEYLASLPKDRRQEIAAVREVVRKNLPRGFDEGMQYGMISWFIPLSRFDKTYNGEPFATASLGIQRNYSALYMMCAYMNPKAPARLQKECREAGKKLDMGKSCLRFRAAADLPLNTIGEIISESTVDWIIEQHEAIYGKRRTAKTRKPAKKAARAKPRARAKH